VTRNGAASGRALTVKSQSERAGAAVGWVQGLGWSALQGFLEIAQPVAAALDVEDMGTVEEPVEDTRAFLPVALVTQTMPLVALTPLLVLMLGRGTAVTLWITISVTFFPAYVMIAQGIAQVPRAALELPRAYGASGWRELRLVTLPASVPWLFAAIKLTLPRALLGVMIAEWLATGRGLGNLLNQSRGYLDFAMIWTVAVVSVLLSVGLYLVAQSIEKVVLARMGMGRDGR